MQTNDEAQHTTKARYTVKALDRLKDVHAQFTDSGQVMVDSIEANWEVRMILTENGFHRRKEQSHGGFEVFAQ